MTQALLRAVGAPGSSGSGLTTSIRSSARPDVQLGRQLRGLRSSSPGCRPASVGAAMPGDHARCRPVPSGTSSAACSVPFSSFSIDSWRRLVMIFVFTDDLICAMRARYGFAAGALPQARFAELLGDGQQPAQRAVLLLLVLDVVVDEVGLQDRVVGLEPDLGLGAAVLLGDLRQPLARRRPVAVAQRDDRRRVLAGRGCGRS